MRRHPRIPETSDVEKGKKAPHLVAALKFDQLTADRSLCSFEHCPKKTAEKGTAANNVRLLTHLINRSKCLPQRVPSKTIGALAELESSGENAAVIGR